MLQNYVKCSNKISVAMEKHKTNPREVTGSSEICVKLLTVFVGCHKNEQLNIYFSIYNIKICVLLFQFHVVLLLLLLLQHYNPGWVLAYSTSLFNSFLFLLSSFQFFFTLSTSTSLRIPSIHLFLGLPAGIYPNGSSFILLIINYVVV